MMRLIQATLLATTAVAGAASAATVNQGTGYALTASGSGLVTYADLTMPMTAAAATTLTVDGVPVKVDALAYRPQTGGLFAYRNRGDATAPGNSVYSVDAATGAMTRLVSGSGRNAAGAIVRTTSDQVGFDFNNALDAARIVSANDENLVFFPQGSTNPSDGTTRASDSLIRATDLFYVEGDRNAGRNPGIFANAYTNAVAQAQVDASTQVQYVLDSALDVLATLGNNAGTLSTLGRLVVDGEALDFSGVGGFDILSPASNDNLGLALLNVADADGVFRSNLYSFALPTMAGDVQATFVSTFGTGFSGFAVAYNGQPEMAPIPLPASALLLLGGLGGLGALRRLRRGA